MWELIWGNASMMQVPFAGWAVLILGFLLGVFAVKAKGARANALVFALAIVVVPAIAVTAQSTLPYTFTNGTVADADEVNANFQALAVASARTALTVVDSQGVGKPPVS